jgi:serine protease Do
VIISEVSPDSPAARAGLRHEDVVIAFNGRPVTSRDELRLAIAQSVPGTTVTLRVIRNQQPQDIAVVIDRLGEPAAAAGGNELFEGVRIAALTDELRREFDVPDAIRGVIVVEVDPNSRFAGVLPVGTVIEQINRVELTDPASARGALGLGRNIFVVSYGGMRRYLAIILN